MATVALTVPSRSFLTEVESLFNVRYPAEFHEFCRDAALRQRTMDPSEPDSTKVLVRAVHTVVHE